MTLYFTDRSLAANKILNTLEQRVEEFLIANAASFFKFQPRTILGFCFRKKSGSGNQVKVTDYMEGYFTRTI